MVGEVGAFLYIPRSLGLAPLTAEILALGAVLLQRVILIDVTGLFA